MSSRDFAWGCRASQSKNWSGRKCSARQRICGASFSSAGCNACSPPGKIFRSSVCDNEKSNESSRRRACHRRHAEACTVDWEVAGAVGDHLPSDELGYERLRGATVAHLRHSVASHRSGNRMLLVHHPMSWSFQLVSIWSHLGWMQQPAGSARSTRRYTTDSIGFNYLSFSKSYSVKPVCHQRLTYVNRSTESCSVQYDRICSFGEFEVNAAQQLNPPCRMPLWAATCLTTVAFPRCNGISWFRILHYQLTRRLLQLGALLSQSTHFHFRGGSTTLTVSSLLHFY